MNGSDSPPASRGRASKSRRGGAHWRFRRRRDFPKDSRSPKHDAGISGTGRSFRSWRLPIDVWRLADALQKRAILILLCSLVLAMIGFNWAYVAANCRAAIKLVRALPPGLAALKLEGQTFNLREQSLQATLDLLQSPELLRRVLGAAQLRIKPEELAARCRISAGSERDPITVTYRGKSPAEAVQVVNAYAREAISLSAEMQREELKQVTDFLVSKLVETDHALKESSRKLISNDAVSELAAPEANAVSFLREKVELAKKGEQIRVRLHTLELQINRLLEEIAKQHPTLVKAREDLDRALLRFTDEHPKVKELRAAIAGIRAQITQQATNGRADLIVPPNSTASTLYLRVVDLQTEKIGLEKQLEETDSASRQLQQKLRSLPESQVQSAAVQADHKSLQARRDLLAQHLSDAQFLLSNSSGCVQVFQWAREADVRSLERFRTALLIGLLCGIMAVFGTSLLVCVWEVLDDRIRTARDLERATRLPLLASLGDLNELSAEEREDWAFRTLTLLKSRVRRADGALICGIISAHHGEGRSTWVDLLAKAARRRGHRVLVVAPPSHHEAAEAVGPEQPDSKAMLALEAPGDLARRLTLAETPPILRLAVPSSIWSLEWRQRWQTALQQWRHLEHLVLLVDLPPASNPQAVLLSEDIPQLIWLCARDRATTTETRTQMETLRCAKCELIGSVFNRAAVPSWRRRLAHLANLIAIAGVLWAWVAQAQVETRTNALAAVQTNAPAHLLSATSPDRLADWQRKLTLGPGDVLNISIYDEPDSGRTGLVIGPDGRINYLEAQDVMASGLTVDELRARLEEILGKIHREPRTVIIPASYRSKQFFMLGSVNHKGAVPLDRPVTLVEAVARAGGFVSKDGLILADFSRSFVIRKKPDGNFAPIGVDFEALFLRGDLMQNLAMAPDDYVYFLPTDLPEVYVLGDGISMPGPLGYVPGLSVLKAIASRGGFGAKAYRSHVLVVRGSLSHPEMVVVNTTDMLKGKAFDFKLEPRDIVYVSRRPWAKAEELIELAITDFLRAVAISWAGANVGPFIDKPIF